MIPALKIAKSNRCLRVRADDEFARQLRRALAAQPVAPCGGYVSKPLP